MGGSFLFPKPLTFSKKRWPRQCPQTGMKHRGCTPEDSSSYSRCNTNLRGTTSGCEHRGHVSQRWENRGSDLLGGYIPSLGNAETGVGRSAWGKCVRMQTQLEANLSDPVLHSQKSTTQKSGMDSRSIFPFGRREKTMHSIVCSRKQDGCFYTPSGPATNPSASAYKDSFPF